MNQKGVDRGQWTVKTLRIAALLFTTYCSLATVLHADRLIASGFETNNLTQTEWSATSGTVSVVSTAKHSGTYALLSNPSSSIGYSHRAFGSNITSGTVYDHFYFCIDTFPNANPVTLEHGNSGGTTIATVDFVTSGSTWRIVNAVTTTTVTGVTALSTGSCTTAGTWYRIEFRVLLSDTVGVVEGILYVGDSTTATETLSITAEDTLTTNIGRVRVGLSVTNSTSDIYFDDVITNTSAGVAPFNTSVGPSKIALLKPASDNTVTWTKTGANCSATTNADCVDDEPGTPDDASGYNTSATANAEDRLDVGSLPAEVPSDADMISLTLMDRWDGNGTTGTRTGHNLLWDELAAQTNGTTHSRCDVVAGTWSISSTAQTPGFDLGARTKANVEAFAFGYEPLNNAECRITAIWANVEWKAAAAAPTGMPKRIIYID